MKRIVDQPYDTYSVNTAIVRGICVKCSNCGGVGMVTADEFSVYFRCTNCGSSRTKERTVYHCDVENLCNQCKRYYRVHIFDSNKQQFSVLNVACPHCGYIMPGKIQKTPSDICTDEIKGGHELFFGFELWFLTEYRGEIIWALNREHLTYLIDYLNADLREKPSESYPMMRKQADQLPTFMKKAKNREGIVKCLKKMQKK